MESCYFTVNEAEVYITYVLALPKLLTNFESVLHGITPWIYRPSLLLWGSHTHFLLFIAPGRQWTLISSLAYFKTLKKESSLKMK